MHSEFSIHRQADRILADAFRRDFESPGQHQCDRKAEQNENDQQGQRPGRQGQRLESDFTDLHQDPADHDIDYPHADNFAFLELGKKTFLRLISNCFPYM